mgnify:CR=1 FL=1
MDLKKLYDCYPHPINLEGRPERETIINQDDINNLIIAVNTTNSVEEFLKQI